MRVGLSPLVTALLLVGAMPAVAGELPDPAPLPFARPDSPGSRAFDAMSTRPPAERPEAEQEHNASPLATALAALDGGDFEAARQIKDDLPAGSIEKQALVWAIAASGSNAVSSSEILAATSELRGWPGLGALHANLERALHRERASPRVVTRLLGSGEATTPEGVILRVRAHLADGDTEEARRLIASHWRTARLEARQEAAIIAEFSELLSTDDHRIRTERMLYIDRISSAARAAVFSGSTALVDAFAAVTRNQKNAAKLLDKVLEEQRTAAYVFATARHLRRTGKFREAAEAMLRAPTDPDLLVDPDAWWIERRVLSRELLDLGDPATAYELAAAHAAESPAHAADAEFHAGWYAFRGLDDAVTGAQHFARIAELAEGPISLARAHYWLGRTAEAGAPEKANEHFELAARHDTTFYGQLAAARLGRRIVETTSPTPTDAQKSRFEAMPGVRAIRALEEVGQQGRANSLSLALADTLKSAGEIELLAAMAEARGDHFLALRIAKRAAQRGVDVGALAHPTGVIPSEADISGSGVALAYAIARQESEFNVSARSGAGALGLLQLLPGTAREMARKTGLDYAPSRLTSDAAYNATLGTSYLDEQLSRFDGSYILTFIGYNAGPRRAQEWVDRYGDPRGQPIEAVVDWIERIPFTETRSYVQRVMENYQVYKMRISGRMDIEDDLVNGRRPTN